MSGPRFLRWLASVLLPSRHREFILGDMEELYARRCRQRGRVLAGAWYLRDLLRSVAGGLAGRRAGGRLSDSSAAALWSDRGGAARSDLRHALRSLRRRPAFTALVVGTIALGVGPATVVFGMANELLSRPLPGVPNTDRAVHVVVSGGGRGGGLSLLHLESLADAVPGLEGVAAYFHFPLIVTPVDGRPIQVETDFVYGDFFGVLGVRPTEGRLLSRESTKPDSDPFVAVISEHLRDRLFGSGVDPTGAALRTRAGDFTILGVTRGGFRGPHAGRSQDVWLPLASMVPLVGYPAELFERRDRPITDQFLGLPTHGVTSEALEAQIEGALRQMVRGSGEDVEYVEAMQASVLPGLHTSPVSREATENALRFMGWAVALILAIACANVANLLLFQNLSRRGAIATHRMLGASSGRIARRQVIESLVLGGLGAAGALLVAYVISRPFEGLALWGRAAIDHPPEAFAQFLFVAAAGMGAALVFGVGPAVLAGRFDLAAALRDSRTRETGRGGWLRAALSAGQLGLTLALSVGALMMLRTLANVTAVDTGLEIEGVVRVALESRVDQSPDARFARYRALLSAVSHVPGVESAALDEYGPHGSQSIGRVWFSGQPYDESLRVAVWPVSPGWFELFEVEPIHGRTFRADDWSSANRAGIVLSRSLAQRLFGHDDVAGETLVGEFFDEPGERRIIGVVGDYRSMADPSAPTDAVFVTFGDYVPAALTLLARPETYSPEWAQELRLAVEAVVSDAPVPQPTLLTDDVARIYEVERLLSHLLTILAVFGVLMSATGLYGVVFFLVSHRTREFAIRSALGADRGRILALVGRFVASLWAAGLAIGIVGAVGLSSFLESHLFGLEPMDPVSIAGASALLCAVCLIASWMPARAALRSDPVDVLREE